MKTTSAALFLACFLIPYDLRADSFGNGQNSFNIDFVFIGNPENAPDNTGYGSMAKSYRIGKYEVSRSMIEAYNVQSGLSITMADMSTTGGNGGNRPATGVSRNAAARFVNWLNTSKGYPPAYKFTTNGANDNIALWSVSDGTAYDSSNPFRNPTAYYFLPSEDEWYKAAYYDAAANSGAGKYWDFPTGSDTAPTSVTGGVLPATAVYNQVVATGPADITNAGGLSPYGTMAQGGNAWERLESSFVAPNDDPTEFHTIRAGYWANVPQSLSSTTRVSNSPGISSSITGFRVASSAANESRTLVASGSNGTVTGAGTYAVYATAVLTAAPTSGYLFTGWTGDVTGNTNPLSVLMDTNKAIGATFLPDTNDDDNDGLTNYQEIVQYGTNPFLQDTDGDTVKDSADAFPLNIAEWLDTDHDGTGDNADTDDDNDGYSDADEINIHHTNPKRADSDGDGLSDPQEIQIHLTNPNLADTDGDGLSDGAEFLTHHTNPLTADSDGDGFLDGYEVLTGKSPLNILDKPALVAEARVAIEFTFPSALAKTYRIEDSLDLVIWTTVESGIAGNGAVIQRFYSTRNAPKRYFRVEEDSQ